MAEFNFVTYKSFEPLSDEWKNALSIALDALWSAWKSFNIESLREFNDYMSEEYNAPEELYFMSDWKHYKESAVFDNVTDDQWLNVQRMVEAETEKMFSNEAVQADIKAKAQEIWGARICTAIIIPQNLAKLEALYMEFNERFIKIVDVS